MKAVLFAFTAAMAVQAAAQTDSTKQLAVDSVTVHKTAFLGIGASFLQPFSHDLYNTGLWPVEGITQLTGKQLNNNYRLGADLNFSLWRNFSVNTEFGAALYDYTIRYGIAESVAPATSTTPAMVTSSTEWSERELHATVYADIGLGYRFLRKDHVDIYTGSGVVLNKPLANQLAPAAEFYVSLQPRIKLSKKAWLQLRVDYGITSREYMQYPNYLLFQGGMAYRFDSVRKEPKKKKYYIRTYED